MDNDSQLKPINILLVEDNPGDVMLTKQALIESKIKTTLNVVMDGEEAVHYLRKEGKHTLVETPDLVLLDLNLPKKDGLSVLAEIKADSHLKFIPIIILSTSSAEEDIASAYARYANCYITKPSDFRQFIHVVKSIEAFWFKVVKFPKSKKRA